MGGTLIIRPVHGSEAVSTVRKGVESMIFGRRSGRARCWVSEGMAVWLPSVPTPVHSDFWFGVMGGWSLFENCTVDASICGQVFKGARWMPWHQEPMKDVGGHDSPRGAVNQALIRGFPNGETRQSSWAVTLA